MVEESTLLQRCREGDALAWEALVRDYQSRMYSVAWHYTRNTEEARDMAQEIFVKVYERLHTFRGAERFLPWLMRLARNACIDRLRRLSARPPTSDVPLDEGPSIATDAPGPEEEAEAEARKRLLYRALDGMNDKHREIIMLREIQGLKLEEVSSLLGLPLGTVKSRCSRARIELASKLRVLDPSYGV